jgi:3-oxoacyl-[acyl-carrier protein] reductase
MIILITGGSSGLGEAITRNLAAAHSNTIYFTYNSSETNARRIEAEFNNTISIKCDFGNRAEVDALAAQIIELNLDVLINNAYTGDVIKTYFHKIPTSEFLIDFEKNLVPTIAVTQQAITIFRKKKSGKIITILTSILVNTPPHGSSLYTANKAYLEQLTKAWAVENKKYNITSNCVSPEFMLTNINKNVDDRIVEQLIKDHPLGKLLTTDEVAESVNFLVHATQQINGLNIVINCASNIK